jgi:hypothetical protein
MDLSWSKRYTLGQNIYGLNTSQPYAFTFYAEFNGISTPGSDYESYKLGFFSVGSGDTVFNATHRYNTTYVLSIIQVYMYYIFLPPSSNILFRIGAYPSPNDPCWSCGAIIDNLKLFPIQSTNILRNGDFEQYTLNNWYPGCTSTATTCIFFGSNTKTAIYPWITLGSYKIFVMGTSNPKPASGNYYIGLNSGNPKYPPNVLSQSVFGLNTTQMYGFYFFLNVQLGCGYDTAQYTGFYQIGSYPVTNFSYNAKTQITSGWVASLT